MTSVHKYDSAVRKKGILPFATTQMDFEGIVLSQISQTEKDTRCTRHLDVECKKAKLINRVQWWLPGAGGVRE